MIALATLLVCLPFLGYRLYEGWYNDYFTKQLAGQVQTGLDESAWADIRAKYPNVNFPGGNESCLCSALCGQSGDGGLAENPQHENISIFPSSKGRITTNI